MNYQDALKIAEEIKGQLSPHCERIEIAGSIRRKRSKVKDIEIVLIPKPFDTGLFANGIAPIINAWEKVKGELPCKYTQRVHPSGVKIDLFFATRENWGYIFAIRTGSAEYSRRVLATTWVRKGYKGKGGFLTSNGNNVTILEEEDLFKRLGLKMIKPENREMSKRTYFR